MKEKQPSAESMITGSQVACAEAVSKPISIADVVQEPPRGGDSAGDPALHELKRKTTHGALVTAFGQAAGVVLRIGSMVILARLLTPEDFGLVGMATASTGFLAMFQELGLSMATVQRGSITREQTSTLFWINLAVGGILAALCAASAPILAAFYHEPRVLWITVLIGSGFIFSGAAAQYGALLRRQMRFAVVTLIEIMVLCLTIALGIGMAVAGQGYWALVAMSVCPAVVNLLGVWAVSGWMPGPPRRGTGVRSMVKYGGTLTLNWFIVYLAYNTDKVLLGRLWGAAALGIYGRAYQFINLPIQNLNSSIGMVAFPALSRLQDDPVRLKSYFLKGYGLFLTLLMPITMGCALFAEDLVLVFLGSKWNATVPVFRLLAPTILAFALINPFSWLMMATGRAARSLKIGLLIAPVVILGYVVGLRYGPQGVAAGFSVAMMFLVAPVIFWSTRGTSITAIDTFKVLIRPLVSVLIGAAAALAAWNFIHLLALPLLRLFAANAVLFGIYAIVLWFVTDQKDVYVGLLRDIGIWRFSDRRRRKASAAPADA